MTKNELGEIDALYNEAFYNGDNDSVWTALPKIPILINEVKNLNYKLSDSFQNNLLETVDKQDKQIAKLKKALKLACNDKMDCPAIYNEPPFKQCKNCKSGENFEECWYRYFIQQAQKQEKKQ